MCIAHYSKKEREIVKEETARERRERSSMYCMYVHVAHVVASIPWTAVSCKLALHIQMFVHVHVYMHTCIYMYMFVWAHELQL